MYISSEMYVACEKCRYNHYGKCDLFISDIDSNNKIDIPYQEKERIKQSLDNFIQTYAADRK